MTYDASTSSVILLDPHGSTWSYRSGDWSNLTAVVGPSPPARNDAVLAYDSSDGYLLLFGGDYLSDRQRPSNETWQFLGGHWANLTPSLRVAPPALGFPAMTYDTYNSTILLVDIGWPPYSQTTTWTFHAGVWRNVTRPGGLTGSAVYPLQLADDPVNHEVVAYVSDVNRSGYLDGGCAGWAPVCNETWIYTGGNWTDVTRGLMPSPSPRESEGLSYDSADGIVLLQGGIDCLGIPCQSLSRSFNNTTWSFTQGHWANVTPARTPP